VIQPYRVETPPLIATSHHDKVGRLVEALSRLVGFLTIDIEEEEKRTSCYDSCDISYPALAQSLRIRRQNLEATIVALKASARL
jgi:hypothetical protein